MNSDCIVIKLRLSMRTNRDGITVKVGLFVISRCYCFYLITVFSCFQVKLKRFTNIRCRYFYWWWNLLNHRLSCWTNLIPDLSLNKIMMQTFGLPQTGMISSYLFFLLISLSFLHPSFIFLLPSFIFLCLFICLSLYLSLTF